MNCVQAAIERWAGYAIAWDDTAAWVQAFGSIGAIIFAVLVPVYIRNMDERQQAGRAILLLRQLLMTTHATWNTLRIILDTREFNDATSATLLERVNAALSIADQVAVDRLGGDATLLLTICRLRLKSLELAIGNLVAAKDKVYEAAAQQPIGPLLDDLAQQAIAFGRFAPRRRGLHWLAWSPQDDEALKQQRRDHAGT